MRTLRIRTRQSCSWIIEELETQDESGDDWEEDSEEPVNLGCGKDTFYYRMGTAESQWESSGLALT